MLSLAVTVHHQNNSSIIVHIPHYAGHSLHARPLAGMAAAVARYNFIPTIFPGADNGKLKTTPAVELSYLTPEEQEDFLSYMESEGCTPSLSQAQKLKEASKESVLTPEKIQHIMAAKPPSVKPRDPQLMIPVAKVERYFPKGFTSDQMQQVIVKLLENYARAHQHGSR